MKSMLCMVCGLLLAGQAMAQPAKDAVKKVEASFEPKAAKPGETVTLKITVELADGYHTYPVTQPAPEAKFSANGLTFPKDGPVVFVGETVDPVGGKTKKVEDYDLLTYPGGGVWAKKAVVNPAAKPGAASSKVKFKLLVCDEDNCFPPKTIELEAAITVSEGAAVEVDAKYKAEVEKALKK